MSVPELLDELDELRAKATPGPWELDASQCCVGSHSAEGYFIAGERTATNEDAALIVAAVNAVPQLTAALRAVAAVVARIDAASNPVPDTDIADDLRTALNGLEAL